MVVFSNRAWASANQPIGDSDELSDDGLVREGKACLREESLGFDLRHGREMYKLQKLGVVSMGRSKRGWEVGKGEVGNGGCEG
ncbi:hypothetical protein FF1_042836 [Malus domestica]